MTARSTSPDRPSRTEPAPVPAGVLVGDASVPTATEAARLAKLAAIRLTDSAPEAAFDAVAHLAQSLLDCAVANVTTVDADRVWFKASTAGRTDAVPRPVAFCGATVDAAATVVIEDTADDARYAQGPLVRDHGLRFYAGVPLRPRVAGFPDEAAVGTLCVLDKRPRRLTEAERATLERLASLATELIEARVTAAEASRLADEARTQALVLARRHSQLRQAERLAGLGSWRLDLAASAVEWSDQIYAIYGLPPGGTPPLDEAMDYFPEGDRAMVSDALAGAAEGRPFEYECDFVTARGEHRRVHCIGEPEMVDGRPVAVIGVFQDVTERHRREQALRRSANTDALTGLANRACFEARLADEVTRARADGRPLGLVMLDLNGFKGVNDAWGHAAGDEVLRRVGAVLAAPGGARGFPARLGGDEFALLVTREADCRDLDALAAQVAADLLLEEVRGGERRVVSAAAGAALLTGGEAGAELVRRADAALYDAKHRRAAAGGGTR